MTRLAYLNLFATLLPSPDNLHRNTHPWRNGHFPDVEVGGQVMLSSEEHLLVLVLDVSNVLLLLLLLWEA